VIFGQARQRCLGRGQESLPTLEFDPMRDEGLIYALRLLEAGVFVDSTSSPLTFHEPSIVATAVPLSVRRPRPTRSCGDVLHPSR